MSVISEQFKYLKEERGKKESTAGNLQVSILGVCMEFFVIAFIICALTPRVASRGREEECSGEEGAIEELHSDLVLFFNLFFCLFSAAC